MQGSTGLNAFASGRLDVELEDEATPAYGDAFAARPGKHHLSACLLLPPAPTHHPPLHSMFLETAAQTRYRRRLGLPDLYLSRKEHLVQHIQCRASCAQTFLLQAFLLP